MNKQNPPRIIPTSLDFVKLRGPKGITGTGGMNGYNSLTCDRNLPNPAREQIVVGPKGRMNNTTITQNMVDSYIVYKKQPIKKIPGAK